jgi:hypothetical protein
MEAAMVMHMHTSGRIAQALQSGMSRRAALRRLGQGVSASALMVSLGREASRAARPDEPPADWFAPDTTFAGHGQVIIGDDPVYLSHLPMFMFDNQHGSRRAHPHHYQVIMEVAFSEEGAHAYIEDRQESGAPLYTFAPEAFPMLDLIAPAAGTSPLASFRGAIVRGHFERDADPQPFDIEWHVVQEDVPVDVTRVIYAHEFSFRPAPVAHLEYILFGQGDELFLAHRITQDPDFDQLLPARSDGHAFTDDELQRGIVVVIPQRENRLAERLMDGDRVEANAQDAGTGVHLATGLQIEAGPEFYFEEGELAFPAEFESTQAEIDAGFGFQ